MGYEYDFFGWCRTRDPIDLPAAFTGAEDEWPNPHHFEVAGADRDILLFANGGKSANDAFVAAARRIVSNAGSGVGLITITGEISTDGKDHLLLIAGNDFHAVPLSRVYNPALPWNDVYEASHYLHQPYEPVDRVAHESSLDMGPARVKGWIRLRADSTGDDAQLATTEIAQIVAACPSLANGVRSNDAYDVTLLVAHDSIDVRSALFALAAVTGRHPRAFGVVYCSTDDERRQWPFSVSNGQSIALRPISLDLADEPQLYPPVDHLSSGLGSGCAALYAKFDGDLAGLVAALESLRESAATPPRDVGSNRYTFDDLLGLVVDVCTRTYEWPETPIAKWPFQLWAHLDRGADPEELARRLEPFVHRLKSAGVDTQPTRVELNFTDFIRVPDDPTVAPIGSIERPERKRDDDAMTAAFDRSAFTIEFPITAMAITDENGNIRPMTPEEEAIYLPLLEAIKKNAEKPNEP